MRRWGLSREPMRSLTNNIEHPKGLNCFFLFVDLNCVSSRETRAIRIRPICISEFLILPLKATASVQAVPHTPPHPTLFCFTCLATMEPNCLCTFNILIITIFERVAARSMRDTIVFKDCVVGLKANTFVSVAWKCRNYIIFISN